jgi:hypothetical protein
MGQNSWGPGGWPIGHCMRVTSRTSTPLERARVLLGAGRQDRWGTSCALEPVLYRDTPGP